MGIHGQQNITKNFQDSRSKNLTNNLVYCILVVVVVVVVLFVVVVVVVIVAVVELDQNKLLGHLVLVYHLVNPNTNPNTFCFKVSAAPSTASALVKGSVCPKVAVNHHEQPFYNPVCIFNCKDICGQRHLRRKPKCKDFHKVCLLFSHLFPSQGDCARGRLTERVLYCPSTNPDLKLTFTSFEVPKHKKNVFG